VVELDNKLEDMEEEQEEMTTAQTTPKSGDSSGQFLTSDDSALDASFMSESIYQKLPSPRSRKHKTIRKVVLVSY